jgi:hypothetical protein
LVRPVVFTTLVLTSAALADDIQINGACVLGTCPPPSGPSDAIQFGQSISGNGSYALVFGDGDQYSIKWTYSASYTGAGTAVTIYPVATYVGSSPSIGNDTIAFDSFQNIYDSSRGSWDGSYTETIPLSLSGNAGAGSTVSGELFWDGQGLGLIGPFGIGNNVGQNTETLTGLDATTLSAEYAFTFNFDAGTQNGAVASSSPVPEPVYTYLMGFGLLALVLLRHRSRKNSVQV